MGRRNSTARSGVGRFMVALVLSGAGLVTAAAGATAAAPASAAPSADKTVRALPFDVDGRWTDNGTAKPIITVVNNTVLINMSYAHRPNAVGSVISANSILVTFPDADTYIGTFSGSGYLSWSNGSAWRKVYTGAMAVNLNSGWGDTQRVVSEISQTNGFLDVNMRAYSNRPNAVGFAINASTISVSFPDDATYTGTLVAPDIIRWSNNSQWRAVFLPPPPQCLRSGILC